MTISSQINTPGGASARRAPQEPLPTKSEEPKDEFISEHNLEAIAIGLTVAVAGTVILGIPAAIGAAGGALGVAGAAVGAAAMSLAAPDDTEYPGLTSPSALSGALSSAAFVGCVAGIGAVAGMSAVVACAGVSVFAGGVFLMAGWQ